MKAVHLPHFKRKLNDVAKQLFLQHGWKLPEGFIYRNKNPLNFTLAEWQQAKRQGLNAKDIKNDIQKCWAVSDNKKSFQQASHEKGFFLAKGDKHRFVAVNRQGEVYSLSRALGVKKHDIQKRLGSPVDLPSVSETTAKIMKDQRGIWDWLNGTYRKTRKLNEAAAKQCARCDRAEHLIQKHLKERQRLQQQFKHLRHKHKQEYDRLKEGLAQYLTSNLVDQALVTTWSQDFDHIHFFLSMVDN